MAAEDARATERRDSGVRAAKGGEELGVLPAVRPAIEGGRLPEFELGLRAGPSDGTRPNLVAIEQRGDALEIGPAVVGMKRFGEAANDVEFVVG